MPTLPNKPSPAQQTIARLISEYFLKKNNGDTEETNKDLVNLHIVDIQINENTKELTILTARPGLFVGVQGKTFDELRAYLKVDKLNIIEAAHWNDYLWVSSF